jgi:rhodanese-related sulfurtransferase
MLQAENRPAIGPELKRVLLEALTICVLGIGLGLCANFLSPRGLSLFRNYFPQAANLALQINTTPPSGRDRPGEFNAMPSAGSQSVPAPAPENQLSEAYARLREKGLHPIDTREAFQLFRDPRYDQELIIFVDARDDSHYQEGHVPGAYQFDRYYPERHLPVVLPACLSAKKVVVYCTGGDCEDSEFAALALRDAGVPAENLLVYAGGYNAWTADKLPLETGDRKSGTLKGDRE